GRACADEPLVLLFDDAHWCDESSAIALAQVMRNNREQPLLVALAAREGELVENLPLQSALRALAQQQQLREIGLAPLSESALEHIIAEHAPAADRITLSRQCAGNPLLAIELARAVSSGARSRSLSALIRERMARCDVDTVEILRWAAVLSNPVDMAMLVRVTGLPDAQIGRALDIAEQQALLVPLEFGFRFAHALIEEAIYSELSPVRQRVMHRRIA